MVKVGSLVMKDIEKGFVVVILIYVWCVLLVLGYSWLGDDDLKLLLKKLVGIVLEVVDSYVLGIWDGEGLVLVVGVVFGLDVICDRLGIVVESYIK